jgi:hypothetical protein
MALGQYYNDYMTVEKFLISKNDGEGEWGETPKWSFKKIANWIEKNL